MQVDDYIDQIALQAAMNGLQLGFFKRMLKILWSLIDAKKHTIVEALYITKDTHSTKDNARRVIPRGSLGLIQGGLKDSV